MKKNETLELLKKIRQLMDSNALRAEDVPLDDIKAGVELEIGSNESTYLPKQFAEINERYRSICKLIGPNETDMDKIRLFLDGMIMTLLTVSDSVKSLANREFFLRMNPGAEQDAEMMEVIEEIHKRGDIRLINYSFMDEYDSYPCEVGYDEDSEMFYVIHREKRMFFPRGWTEQRAIDYYRSLIGEQDLRSPHCYIKEGYEVRPGDVILDVGAAEGVFALNHIDEAEKIYLFDADDEWIEALKRTFENYRDKIEIIKGYVGNKTGDGNVSIDSVLQGQKVNYIKMDIEGFERDALIGARQVIDTNPDMACAICSYHCHGDSEWITTYLEELGFETAHSKGYMSPDWSYESRLYADLRRGVVFGKRRGN